MNKDVSPLKLSPYTPLKKDLSPFKKHNVQSPKYNYSKIPSNQTKLNNSQMNPELIKNLIQSAHIIGHISGEKATSPQPINKPRFLETIKGRDKSDLYIKSQKKDFLSAQQSQQSPGLRIRDRKLSVNDLTSGNNIKKQIEFQIIQIEEQEEVTVMRDRKLSYQVSNYKPPVKKQSNIREIQAPRRESDMLPCYVTRSKKQMEAQQKLSFSTYTPKNMVDSGFKKPFPFIKEKLRKNSQNQNNIQTSQQTILTGSQKAIQVPSFLSKKSKKTIDDDEDIRISAKSEKLEYIERKFSLKDFTLIKQLGEGKFGKVFLVKEKKSNFVCAMKVFKKSQIKNDNFIDQFIRQMKIQCYINHPNVIKMYGYFDDLSYFYILIELACDGTLFKFLEQRQRQARHQELAKSLTSTSGSEDSDKDLSSSNKGEKSNSISNLSLKQISIIMYQLCSGLNYLHNNHIIHRDLKPQNIVIHEKTIKLCDFGWSVFKGTTMRNTFCGTPLYLCPQLIIGDEYDEKVDIWAIGIMLYEFMVDTNPFKIHKQEDLANIVYNKIELETEKKNVEEDIRDLILGCLKKNPLERYDIKQIMNHKIFHKYCPELMTEIKNTRTTKMSDIMK